MKVAILLAVLPFAAADLIARQNEFQNAPECVQSCWAINALAAANSSGCSINGDAPDPSVVSCLCNDASFLKNIGNCFETSCSAEDATAGNQLAAQFCGPYVGGGSALPAPVSLVQSASVSSVSASISAVLSSASGAVGSAQSSASNAAASIASSASGAVASITSSASGVRASASSAASAASSVASTAASAASSAAAPSGAAVGLGAQVGWVAGAGALAGFLAL